MELCDPKTGSFMMRGHPSISTRKEFIETAFLKIHEVVIAVEFTAAVTANAEVFEAARGACHKMDASDPWKRTL